MSKICLYCDNPLTGQQRKYCSIRCGHKYHLFLKRQQRDKFNDYKLSKGCKKCGYNKCVAALSFHHKLPDKKENEYMFNLWVKSTYKNDPVAKAELAKCELLCNNCHAEVHYRRSIKGEV